MKKITTLSLLIATIAFAKAQHFDTTGVGTWPLLTNSYQTWMQGAFEANRDTSNPYDFGWGAYDVSTHLISGDSIYIIKTVAGDYKAISIDEYASSVYKVTYSNLDKSNKVTKSLNRTPYDTRNFFYYSIDNDQVKDLEPTSDDWDILFSKYPVMMPGFGAYPVAGVLTNHNVEVSQVSFAVGGTYSLSDTANYPWSSDISTIGYDWKDAFASIVHDTIVYFVRDQFGNINELQFTEYGGSATGKFGFEVNGNPDSILLGAGNTNQVYYSLQNDSNVAVNQDHDWDIAIYAQSSFSDLPVRINEVGGVELYVYPLSDINYWNVVGLEEQTVSILSVYPNPAKDVLTIAAHFGQTQNMHVSFYNQVGSLVKTHKLTGQNGISENTIDISELGAGIYIVKLQGDNYSATTRLIVQ